MSLNRSIKPIPTDEILFSIPEINEFKLENGLKVLFVKKDNLPIIQMNLIAECGSKFDPENKKGLANLFAMLIDEGAGSFNALELSDEFEMLGANFNIGCGNDTINFTLQTLTDNFDKALQIYSTVILSPHLNEKDFEREKRKIKIKILQIQDDPENIASSLFDKITYGENNPYSFQTIGYEDTITNISVNDVKDFYAQYFKPNNSSLIVVGDISIEILKEKLNRNLSSWANENTASLEIKRNKKSSNQIYIFDKKGSVQSEIRIGHLTSKRNENNYFAKHILNTILGGQFSSRINLNLREDKGYTYGAFSRFNYLKDDAYFYVSTSVGQENTANAVNEIVKELSKIKDGVTAEELLFAKSSIIRKFPSSFETYSQIASILSGKVIYNLEENYFDNYINNIKNVTREEVKKSAEKNVFSHQLVIVIVGEKEKIEAGLIDLNIGDINESDINGEILKS